MEFEPANKVSARGSMKSVRIIIWLETHEKSIVPDFNGFFVTGSFVTECL
jgi:hypothetical protein